MLIAEGNSNLYDFLNILNQNKDLMKKYESLIEHKSKIFNKIELDFIEQLLTTPIIVYLKKDSILNNSFDSNITDYVKKIEHIDTPELIIFLDKIEKSDRKKFNVTWIALELNGEVNFDKNKLFKEFVYVDFNLDKTSTNGRLDINRYENRAKEFLGNIEKKYFKQFKGFFMKNLFKIQIAEDKRKYVKNDLRYIIDFEEELEKHKKSYFKIECLLCKESFVVSSEIRARNVLKAKDIFELNNDHSRIILKCNHKDTLINQIDYIPYKGNIQFSFKPVFKINENKVDEKILFFALLQYFYNFNLSKDGKNIENINKQNEVINFSVEEYIKKREKNEK